MSQGGEGDPHGRLARGAGPDLHARTVDTLRGPERGNAIASRTPLETTILCLVARRPSTGYELVKLLRRFPVRGRGQSPGAVYPALARLRRAGLVAANERPTLRPYMNAARRAQRRGETVAQSFKPSPRRTLEYLLTPTGRDWLREWVARPVSEDLMLERPEELLLQFAFLPALRDGGSTRRFLLQYRNTAEALAEDVRRELHRSGEDASPTGRLGLELSLALFETRRAWARQALDRLAAAGVVPEPEVGKKSRC